MGNAVLTRYTVPLDMDNIENTINGYIVTSIQLASQLLFSGKIVTTTPATGEIAVGDEKYKDFIIYKFDKQITAVNIKNYSAATDKWSTNLNTSGTSDASVATISTSKSQYASTTTINRVIRQSETLLLASYITTFNHSYTHRGDTFTSVGNNHYNIYLLVSGTSLIARIKYRAHLVNAASYAYPANTKIQSNAFNLGYVGVELV